MVSLYEKKAEIRSAVRGAAAAGRRRGPGAQVLQRHCPGPHARLYRAVPLSLAFAGGAAPAFPYPQPRGAAFAAGRYGFHAQQGKHTAGRLGSEPGAGRQRQRDVPGQQKQLPQRRADAAGGGF